MSDSARTGYARLVAGSTDRAFRKAGVAARRELLALAAAESRPAGEGDVATEEGLALAGGDPEALDIAELLVENCMGYLPLPLGLAGGFLVDGEARALPMAVEEPSVIAAAAHGAAIAARGGGFVTWALDPVMRAQVYLEAAAPGAEAALDALGPEVGGRIAELFPSLLSRGGGFRDWSVGRLPETGLVACELALDVRDAMGANMLNTAAEALRPRLEAVSGGKVLMAILSNQARDRLAGARFRLPVGALGPESGSAGAEETAKRLVLAGALAAEDPRRAVTHNKGIMNGISALALATMNDWRAIEAGAHAWAARDGRYRGLSRYRLEDGFLVGELELPLAFATVGGAVDLHPVARHSLALLGSPDSRGLARAAAALGLAQNLAALLALVTGGIQRGHMRFHAPRVAYRAGARGGEIREVADSLSASGDYSGEAARRSLGALRAAAGAPGVKPGRADGAARGGAPDGAIPGAAGPAAASPSGGRGAS